MTVTEDGHGHETTVIVRCASHRARAKLLRVTTGEALFSMRRSCGGGFYRIPATKLDAARAITGVTKARDTADLMRCW